MATEHHAEQFAMSSHPDIVAMRAAYAQRSETGLAMTAEGLAFLAGIYAAISPWVIGFDSQSTLAVSNLVVGLAVAVLTLGLAAAYERTHGMAWVNVVLGAWLIVSPWLVSGVDRTSAVLWSNIVVGAVVLVLGLVSTGMGMMRLDRPDATHARLR